MNNFLFLFFSISMFAGNDRPVFTETGIKFQSENVSIEFVNSFMEIDEIYIVDSDGSLELRTSKTVNFIQILDESGELQYQMPVESSLINIDLKDFAMGDYNINVLLDDVVINGSFKKN